MNMKTTTLLLHLEYSPGQRNRRSSSPSHLNRKSTDVRTSGATVQGLHRSQGSWLTSCTETFPMLSGLFSDKAGRHMDVTKAKYLADRQQLFCCLLTSNLSKSLISLVLGHESSPRSLIPNPQCEINTQKSLLEAISGIGI